MHDLSPVGGFERIGDLHRNVERLIRRDRALGNPVRQRRDFHQLHDERRRAVSTLESIDLSDIRMIERGEHFGLTLEACEPVGVPGEGGRQDFDRDVALEIGVGRPIDLVHATDTE
jgi:hypothetical protein